MASDLANGPDAHVPVSAQTLARELEELIAALDRRVPRMERAGELAIARDAAALRAMAVARLATIVGTRGVDAQGNPISSQHERTP